jgi:hypothetical protein
MRCRVISIGGVPRIQVVVVHMLAVCMSLSALMTRMHVLTSAALVCLAPLPPLPPLSHLVQHFHRCHKTRNARLGVLPTQTQASWFGRALNFWRAAQGAGRDLIRRRVGRFADLRGYCAHMMCMCVCVSLYACERVSGGLPGYGGTAGYDIYVRICKV